MFTFKDGDITAYVTQARTITSIKGNSTVVYPFYNSSGVNSNSMGTWFPWMGYFKHPIDDPTCRDLYMVKPVTRTVSAEAAAILTTHLKDDAPSFINRMGNDEALAISCSLGGGDWDKYPKMREEIMSASCTSKFIKPIEKFTLNDRLVQELPEEEKNQIVNFNGVACHSLAKKSHAEMAVHMEGIVQQESERYVSCYSIQKTQAFPTTDEVNGLVQLTHARELREKYVGTVSHLVHMERAKEKAKMQEVDGAQLNQTGGDFQPK